MPILDEGFFHALQEDPKDDATRLVYADYLEEEHGDDNSTARAEFIRVQVELAALVPTSRQEHEHAAELTTRQNELLARWERVWLGHWASVLDRWVFRRGFVEAVAA